MALSVADFSARIKEKYPQYKELDDLDLTNRIIEKYPEYREQVTFSSGEESEVSAQGLANTSGEFGQPSNNSSEQSSGYSEWLTQNNITDVDQLGNGVDYDYKAFFDNEGGISLTEGQHLTDAYKKPNHPTFSSGSRYSTEEQKGGDWVQDESGNWTFEASPFNLKQHSTEELINYFSQSDPNANLVLPDGTLAYRGSQPTETVTLDETNAQVNPDGSFVLEVDVEGTDVAGALNPDTNPDFITSVKNTAANKINVLKGAIPRLNVVSTDLFSAVFGDEIARKIYENDPIRNWFAEPETLEEVRNEAYSTLSALNAKQLPTQGIVENIESGNFQNLPAAAVDALGSLVSTAIPSMLTAGAGLYTEMVGESIVDFNTEKAKRLGLSVEELYRQGKAEVGTPVVLGTISGGLEHVGLRGLQANITRKLTGSTARKIATFLGDANKEGVTEFLQTGIEEANRKLGQGQSMTDAGSAAADVMFSKQGLEAYLMGVVASGSAGGIGQLTKNLVTRQAKQNVEQQATTIANLQTSLDNVNISENTKQILQQQIEEAQQNVVNTVLEDFDINANLTEQQDRQISTLMTELESVQEAINDPNLAEEAKSALRPRAEQLSTQIDEIVNTEQTEQTQEETPVTEITEIWSRPENERGTPDSEEAIARDTERITTEFQEGTIDETTFNQAQAEISNRAEALSVETVQEDNVEEASVQETPAFTEPEQAEIVNTLTTSGFTEQESTSFIEDITSQEGRQRRLTDSAARIRETWTRLRQQGIADNPEQRDQDVARLIRDVTEYAAVAIVDGTVRTARQLANTLGIELDDNIEQAFNRANEIATTYNNSIITPRRQQTRTTINQATRGGIQGTTTVTNRQALANQIRTLNRGIRMGMQNQRETQRAKDTRLNEVRDNVTRMINSFNNTDLFRGASVPANLVPRLVRRLNNAKTETALLNFSEYLEKVVDDIEYDNKARQASSNSTRLSRLEKSGNLKTQTSLRPLIKRLGDIGKRPTTITDLDEYNRIAGLVIDRQGNIGISNVELEAYLNNEVRQQQIEASKRETELNEAKKEAELKRIQDLIDEYGLEGTAEEYWQAVKEHDDSTVLIKPEQEERTNLTDQLITMINANRQGLPSSGNGLSAYESGVLEALKKTKLDNLSNVELRQLNTAISNAVVNNDYNTGTIDIVGRYKATIEANTWRETFNDRLNTVIQGTSTSWNIITGKILAPSEWKLDTNQLFRSMSSTRELGESLYGYVMGDVDRGFIRAKQTLDKAVKSALKIYDDRKLKVQDSYDVGAALYLLNYETDGRWQSPQEAYEVKKSMIGQSIQLLEATLAIRSDNLKRKERRRYRRDLDNLNKVIRKANQYFMVENFQENFLSPSQRELYDHIINTWDSQSEKARLHYAKLGVRFTDSDLYAPITYNRIVTSKAAPDMELGIDRFHRAGAIDNEGKHVAERQNVRVLPKRDTGTGQQISMYLNLDAIKNFDRELSRRLVDMETIDARVKAKYLLSNQELINAVDRNGEVANHENLVWKTQMNIKDLTGTSGFINDYDQNLDAIINQSTRLFYRGAVGSWTQIVNQSVTNIPSVIANTSSGSWSKATKMMITNGATDIDRLMRASNASAYSRIGSSTEDRMMTTIAEMENETDNNLRKGLSKTNEIIGKVVYEGLRLGDNFNTYNSWMSGYVESLKKQGIIKKASQFTDEMLEEHITNPNLEAAQFADGIASSINATVRRASRAESTKNRSISQRILNSIVGNPLKSFATSQNMEARLAFRNLMRNDFTSRDIEIVGAYLANVFILSNLVRYMWGVGFQAAGSAIAGIILGGADDEDEKAEERRLKDLNLTKEQEKDIKLNRKIISMIAQGMGNVMFGSQPIWIEQAATSGLDIAYTKLILPNYNKGKNKQDKARDPLPATLFFTSADNVFGVGVLDSYAQLYNTVDKMATDKLPLDEEAAAKLQAMRVLAGVSELGILGADFKRISQQTLYSMEKTVKDGFYTMSNSYGVIKEAVNKYGIKPLAPFNTSQLYLEDSRGEIKSFVLSDNEIRDINREIGNEMVTLLPEYGYGKSVNNFNKSNYSIQDINADMSELKSEAKRNVLERRYKGYFVSSRQKFNTQQEEEEE